jgi:tRNA threonylcarbamoyladenosine biosynthesis protein TsaB
MSERQNGRPLILAIETAARAGSVAVARGEAILSAREGDASVSHSTNLIEMIDEALRDAGAKLSDVDLFAVAVGPGSFTGLRIGLATVKAFAAATDRPAVGISTLAAIAHAARASGKIVSLLPAGRGELFAQMFSISNDDVIALDSAAHLGAKELLRKYESIDAQWAGEGVQKLQQYLEAESLADAKRSIAPESATSENGQNQSHLAASIAVLALKDFREGKSIKADELHAIYVRPSDAEINERWQQQKAEASTQN